MAGTPPSDRHPFGDAGDRRDDSAKLNTGSGQSQNILDETKDTFGKTSVDKNVGETIDAGKEGELSARVDQILDQQVGTTTRSGTELKKTLANNAGFRVGEEPDMHKLAQSKQP